MCTVYMSLCVCMCVHVCVCVFNLTADAVGVVVCSAQEVRHRHQQRGQAGEQSSASNEARPVDSTPEETHEDDEDGVSHLDTQTPRQ